MKRIFKKTFKYLIFLSFFCIVYAKDNKPYHTVLAIDANDDGKIGQVDLKPSKDFILLKVNPPRLKEGQMVVQTQSYNIYAVATVEDLLKPNAVKQMYAGRLGKDNSIKTYTLSNMGYSRIEKKKDSNGEEKFFLVGNKGKIKQINIIQMSLIPHQNYDLENIVKKIKL